MKNESLITISERTGYSISTVSRVLNGQASINRISEKAVTEITAEAERCNYTPSLLAKSLRTSRTDTIGLLIPSIENPYFANMAGSIIVEAKAHGYNVIIADTMESEEHEREGVRALASRKVDGIVIVPSGQNSALLEDINNRTPVVLIDRYYNSTTLPYVCTDNYRGALMATEHLIQNGHRDILCIQGPAYQTPVQERVRGYMDALRGAHIESRARIAGEDFSIQNGYLEAKLALNSNNSPSAIFSLSNTILLGAIKAIRESALRIPDDISIISFDDNKFLDFLDPAITRIAQPIREIGILAIKLLVQKINDFRAGNSITMQGTQLQIPPQLIVCNSVSKN